MTFASITKALVPRLVNPTIMWQKYFSRSALNVQYVRVEGNHSFRLKQLNYIARYPKK